MKTLLLLTVACFMISVGFTLPFSEGNAQYDELKDIAGDFKTENPNSDDGLDTEDEEFYDEDVDDDDNDQDGEKTAEDYEDDEDQTAVDNEDEIGGMDGIDEDDDTAGSGGSLICRFPRVRDLCRSPRIRRRLCTLIRRC